MVPNWLSFADGIKIQKLDANTYRADLDNTFTIGSGE